MRVLQEKGFTLIELLVVVAIIGILASLGVAQYSEYKKYAYDTKALSALTQIIATEEVHYVDSNRYRGFEEDEQPHNSPGISAQYPIRWSSDVTGIAVAITDTTFCAYSFHSKGSLAYFFQTTPIESSLPHGIITSHEKEDFLDNLSNCEH